MGIEIERRYLIRVPEEYWDGLGEGHDFRQGYVRNGEPSVRIRLGEPRGPVLTCKSGRGIRRSEVEAVVPEDVAEALMEAAEDRVVLKTRWKVGPWEVDRFGGDLEGLALMEIELEAEDDPVPSTPEGIQVIREVTDDKQFVSGRLARMSPKQQQKLVRKVYEEVEG